MILQSINVHPAVIVGSRRKSIDHPQSLSTSVTKALNAARRSVKSSSSDLDERHLYNARSAADEYITRLELNDLIAYCCLADSYWQLYSN